MEEETDSPAELASQETSALNHTPGSGVTDDLNFTGDKGKKVSKLSKVPGKLNKFKSKKWLLLLGGLGGGLGVIGLIVLLFILANLLKIPALSTYIVEREFTRINRQFADNADRITEEDLAVAATSDTGPDSLRSQLEEQYQDLDDLTLDKLEDYHPGTVLQNLDQTDDLKITATTNEYGPLLDNIELDGKIYRITPMTGKLANFNPEFSQSQIEQLGDGFAPDFTTALENSMETDGVGSIIRYSVAEGVQQELGVNLIAWTLEDFSGETPSEARVTLDQDAYKTVSESGTNEPVLIWNRTNRQLKLMPHKQPRRTSKIPLLWQPLRLLVA